MMRLMTLLLAACLTLNVAAREITVTFKASDNVRDLAQTHLNNPDLWPDILAANGLQAVHELKPGMSLKIPVQIILRVEKTVQSAQSVIQQASRNGARILAPAPINEAIQRLAEALTARRQGEWKNAADYAVQALKQADAALAETVKQRNQPLEARLEEVIGTVENRPPGAWAWKKAKKGQVLAEQEKLRTLSNSSASIRFRDDSRLQLNANAQLLIRQMRQDNLNQRKQTGVVLQGGDVYALLTSNAQQKNFAVDLPGVETEVESSNFWVQKGQGTTRFANYNGKLAVKAGGAEVVLKENQGTLVKPNAQPQAPKDLLPAPDKLNPGDYAVFYKDGLRLSWSPVENASGYWLEIAADSQFKNILINKDLLQQAEFFYPLPADGLYYWRVASVDDEGLPGAKSKVRFFKVQADDTPPYLVLAQPASGAIVSSASVIVAGKTEAKASVQSGDISIDVDQDGTFQYEHSLQSGSNTIHIKATDIAGNVSEITRQVTYMSDDAVPLAYDETLPRLAERHFVVNQADFTLKAHTLPNAQIQISGENGFNSQVFAAQDGHFQVNLKLNAPTQTFAITATLPSGVSSQETLTIERDLEAPTLEIRQQPSKLTNHPQVDLAGQLQNAQSLLINDTPVEIDSDGAFTYTLPLKNGKNAIVIQARDLAGNTNSRHYTTTLDMDAPRLVSQTVTPGQVKGGETLAILVKAEDVSGLKAGAAYELDIDGKSFQGYLKLCPARTCYEGELRLPANVAGKVYWVSLTLEDYAGNKKTFTGD
jgi:uncharacterized protein YfaP (DUF2135 family)